MGFQVQSKLIEIPSMIRTKPIITAMYIGWLLVNIASAIAMIPIINTSIEVNVDTRFFLDINPVTPNTIIMSPTIQNCMALRNDNESIKKMNINPNIADIIPIMIVMLAVVSSKDCFMLYPMNAAERPKNSKLNPTITETKSGKNIGKIMKIKPRIAQIVPTLLLILIISPPFKLINIYVQTSI